MRRLELASIIVRALEEDFKGNTPSQDEANLMINTLLREIASSVTEGRMVAIRGFGSFKPKYYKGNTNSGIFQRDIKKSARVKTSTFARPTFKAGTYLRTIK
ncbi:hypothetical protein CKF54_01915 [Psittacicella hinzii]|uniref:Integration host factor subunit beta n=1 Tax=Psittacicella hinzii TaxID=2028575 RepID=A0A3A1Y9Y3_9GAMM|nr:HU family DNA-binding protein [Psittacicella hinzii]RIY33998.1 hypothetical protein CKF54_01915 [Psittacicella hinzii]